jgi:hypothetical protein
MDLRGAAHVRGAREHLMGLCWACPHGELAERWCSRDTRRKRLSIDSVLSRSVDFIIDVLFESVGGSKARATVIVME